MRRPVNRRAVETEPHLIWNAFIDLIAVEAYDQLSETQRKAHLVFWYDSEVQNGGHAQYFENRGTHQLAETIQALRALRMDCQAEVLQRASAVRAVAHGLSEADAAYHRCLPTVLEALEKHLADNSDEYVVFT